MSDNSNYGFSDDNDFDDEYNYDGAYGGYDDLYDEKSYLYDFDPFARYSDLKENSTLTYRLLIRFFVLGKNENL